MSSRRAFFAPSGKQLIALGEEIKFPFIAEAILSFFCTRRKDGSRFPSLESSLVTSRSAKVLKVLCYF